jgi:phosphate transport system substrate-binding protein
VESTKHRRLAWLSILLVFGLIAAACGDDDEADAGTDGEDSENEDAGGEGGGDISGSINISGSSTVLPISELVAEDFDLSNDGATTTTVDGPGTGDGFELFCNGETDISDASRAIKDEEAEVCESNGVEFVEIQVAYDGMAVMTNPNNDIECLNFADLYAMVGPESEGFSNWSDASGIAGELGSSTELPDESLDLTGPGTESGTYDSFIEIALEGYAEERGEDATTRTDYSANADDNIIISNIEGSDTSLGWVGFAYASEAGEGVRSVPIAPDAEGCDAAVEPSDETISDGSYPLSRPLFIYVNTAKAEENPALAPFVDFYLADLNSFVEEAGYVVMPDDQLEENVAAWEGR